MKTEGAIDNGQSRDIYNIGYTRHRTMTKTIKKKQKKTSQNKNKTTEKTKKMSKTNPTRNQG
jgi:hypothetical protein